MDWLDEDIETAWLEELLSMIRTHTNLVWQMMTKRPYKWDIRINRVINSTMDEELQAWLRAWMKGEPPPNVWLGVSCETQRFSDKRVPANLLIPAVKHFIVYEPLTQEILIEQSVSIFNKPVRYGSMWVICGGEYNLAKKKIDPEVKKKTKAALIENATTMLAECKKLGIPFYMQQVDTPPCALTKLPKKLQVREIPSYE